MVKRLCGLSSMTGGKSSKLTTGHTNSIFVGHKSRNLRSLSVCTDEKIKILKDLYVP